MKVFDVKLYSVRLCGCWGLSVWRHSVLSCWVLSFFVVVLVNVEMNTEGESVLVVRFNKRHVTY